MKNLNFKKSLFTVLMSTLALSSCGKDENSNNNNDSKLRTGFVQGFIIDGITNQPIAIPDSSTEQGVRVLVHNRLINARSAAAVHAIAQESDVLKGEYAIGNIPLYEKFPILVDIPGYQKFQGYVNINSRVAPLAADTTEDVVRINPTEIANIMLFPLGHKSQDLNMNITSNAMPVVGAEIKLNYASANTLGVPSQYENFLRPVNTRMGSLIGKTNEKGQVVFAKDQLVMGGHYQYTIIPPSGLEDAEITTGTVIAGLVSSGLTLGEATPYYVSIEMKSADPALNIVSHSLSLNSPDSEGRLIVLFNREIEIVAGTEKGITAVLVNSEEAELTSDDQKAAVSIQGNKLIVTPKWKNGQKPNLTVEKNIAVVYSGIIVRAKNGTDRNSILSLEGVLSSLKVTLN